MSEPRPITYQDEHDAIRARLERWISNARRNIRNIQDELATGDPVNPITLSARMADYFAKIEAWEEVLKVI